MTHTPEPWQVSLTDDTTIVHKHSDGTQSVIAETDGDYNEPDLWPVMEANARRIVACVNALKGFSTEAIEAGAVKGLVDALEDCRAGLQYVRDHHGDLYGVGFDRCFEKADAALSQLAEAQDA